MVQSVSDKTTDNDVQPENVFNAVDRVASQLSAIETFMSRRFDEISMEINATSQQMDMAEEGIIRRFTEVLEVIAAIAHKGDGSTPANAGVELDAVVDMTEDAANRILDAAGRINACIHKPGNWEDSDVRQKALDSINADVEEIFMSCSFQDITGQRIRKTLENLNEIEERLSHALEKMGIKINLEENETLKKEVAASQDDIDALFGNGNSDSKD